MHYTKDMGMCLQTSLGQSFKWVIKVIRYAFNIVLPLKKKKENIPLVDFHIIQGQLSSSRAGFPKLCYSVEYDLILV